MSNEAFEKWYEDQIWGNETWKDGLRLAWEACESNHVQKIHELALDWQVKTQRIQELEADKAELLKALILAKNLIDCFGKCKKVDAIIEKYEEN